MDEHQRQLGRHCQVCGSKGATMKACSDHEELLLEASDIPT